MIAWRSETVRQFGKHSISHSAVTSIASSYANIRGIKYAFMVSLDHKLRIWNFRTNKIAYIADILHPDVDPTNTPRPFLEASTSHLVKIYENTDDDTALCVTFSPLGNGEFKFWRVQGDGHDGLEVIDLFPHNHLKPQLPVTWVVADFAVVEERTPVTNYAIWILCKDNADYDVHKLEFQNGSTKQVHDAWHGNWYAMADTRSQAKKQVESISPLPNDSSDGTDKWLGFIMAPGRYTLATIETGLAIYASQFGSTKNALRISGSLSERMCATISSMVTLGRTSDGQMNFDDFRLATNAQWKSFNNVLDQLDNFRGEPLTLAFDSEAQMAWLVHADGVTAVRESSNLEKIWHNTEVQSGTEHMTALVTAAAKFRRSKNISHEMRHNFEAALLSELFEEPSTIDSVRMRAIYEKCDFANQIGQDEFDQLREDLQGSFTDVTPQVYEEIFRLMTSPEDIHMGQSPLPLTEFGNKLVIKGVQDTVELHRDICLDQLFLLILIEAEINHGDEGIGFDASSIFDTLIINLTRLELINWLASTQITLSLPKERSNSIVDSTSSLTKKATSNFETVTALEGVLRHLFSHDVNREEPMSKIITETILQICDPDSQYELAPSLTQCFLLKHGRPDLAMDFSRFTLLHPFDVYILGRTYLATNDAYGAATLFKKAAFGIGKGSSPKLVMTKLTRF
jgi:nuclear pore complex protein Nup160